MDATIKFWNFISLFQVDVYQEIKPSKESACKRYKGGRKQFLFKCLVITRRTETNQMTLRFYVIWLIPVYASGKGP